MDRLVERLEAARPHGNHHANAGLCLEAAALIKSLLARIEAAEKVIEQAREALEAISAQWVLGKPLDEILRAAHDELTEWLETGAR